VQHFWRKRAETVLVRRPHVSDRGAKHPAKSNRASSDEPKRKGCVTQEWLCALRVLRPPPDQVTPEGGARNLNAPARRSKNRSAQPPTSSLVRSIQFIFIFMPAAVEAGASVDFATALALVELGVFTEAITFLGVLAAEDPGRIT